MEQLMDDETNPRDLHGDGCNIQSGSVEIGENFTSGADGMRNEQPWRQRSFNWESIVEFDRSRAEDVKAIWMFDPGIKIRNRNVEAYYCFRKLVEMNDVSEPMRCAKRWGSESKGRRWKETKVGSRPKLNLQPSTLPIEEGPKIEIAAGMKSKSSNPFGNAQFCSRIRFYCGFNKNPPFYSFIFPNNHHFLNFPPNCRLYAIVDNKSNPTFMIYNSNYENPIIKKEGLLDAVNGALAFLCVMKLGGSFVASVERMREMANLILCFYEKRSIIAFFTMRKTINNLIRVGEKGVSYGFTNVSEIEELNCIKDLHLRTIKEFGMDGSLITEQLEELELLMNGMSVAEKGSQR